jgi:membrane protease YdiL (CAAX protease family)
VDERRSVLFAMVLYLFLTLMLGCITAPGIYVLFESFLFDGAVPWPYSRVFHRVILVWAVILFFVFRARLQVNFLRSAFKIHTSSSVFWDFFLGLITSFAISGVFLSVYIVRGELALSFPELGRSVYLLIKSLLSGVLISIIEEGFFRALVFTVLLRVLGLFPAAVLSSSLYAVVHFIQPSKAWELPGANPLNGFIYLAETTQRASMDGFLSGLFGFFLVGLLLSLVYYRTRSLVLCIGLHTGWVLLMKFQTYFLKATPALDLPEALGKRYFLLGEGLGWASIVLVGLSVLFLAQRLQQSRDYSV